MVTGAAENRKQQQTMSELHAKGTTPVSTFEDNRKGTVTFVTWRRQVLTYAEEWGGETGRLTMLGELHGVDPGHPAAACKKIYVDLIYNQDIRVYPEDRYTETANSSR